AVPTVMGDVMQLGRVMQMAALYAVLSLDMRPVRSQPVDTATIVRNSADQIPPPWQASLN
ncbi:MAG TPA: hypothetical protein VFX84_02360, partial [Candidatus Saccharimonadales bacterium]|nr:hypothetical protein [Candidatus Saccharimonadales bacterium]